MIANSLRGMWGPFLLGVGNHLWQSTLFALMIAGLTFALRKNHARTRYWLWLVASTKFLVPFSLLVVLGGHLAWLHPASAPYEAKTSVAPYVVMEKMSQPFTVANDSSVVTTFPTATAIGGRDSFAARVTALPKPIPPLQAALGAVWICGLLTVVVTWITRWWRMSAAIRRAVPLLEGREVDALRRMENLGGLRRNIELRLLPASLEPGIFGFVRPVLLWPQAMSPRLEDAHLEAILAHEVWHVRRLDNLTAAMHMVVEAVFWFHPLVWWLETQLVEERERACDEEVLQTCGERAIYAESILKVCEFCVESPLACVSGVTGSDLKKRIVQIMSQRTARRLTVGNKLLLAAAGLVVVAAPIVLGQTQVAQKVALATLKAAPASFREEAYNLLPEAATSTSENAHGIVRRADEPLAATNNLSRSASVALVPSKPDEQASDASASGTLPVPVLGAQKLEFDVASIRQNKTGLPPAGDKQRSNVPLGPGNVFGSSEGFLSATNFSLLNYLEFAYKLTDYQEEQLRGMLPNWVLTERYNIEARTENHKVTKDQMRLMMQSLLAERFKLGVHYETRQATVYALTMVKPAIMGPKLQFHTADANCFNYPPSPTAPDGTETPKQPEIVANGYPAVCGGILGVPASAVDRYSFGARNVSMKLIASSLSSWGNLGRPVVDQTGLSGTYDFVLEFTPEPPPKYAKGVDSGGPTFEEALKKQLGLKLVSQKGQLPFLVLDHVEHLTDN